MSTPIEQNYFQQFCAVGKKRLIKKGECLYSLDRVNDYVFCIEEGLCALLSITKDGEEKIYNYFSSGNIINFTPAYLSAPPTTANTAFYMYARTNCVVYEIPYKTFYTLLSDHPELNRYIMSLFASHFSEILGHFHFMQEASVPSRLCKTLLDFSHTTAGVRMVDRHFNYVELGKYLGVHTVTISRIMRMLKQEGAITKEGHAIVILDADLLGAYVNETRTLSY